MTEKEFQQIANWQKRQSEKIKYAKKLPDKIGSLVDEFVKKIEPKQKRFSNINSIWKSILPQGLAENSEIIDLKSGTLKVKVKSPPMIYQFQMISQKLLTELNSQSKRTKIKNIKFQL